jgi:hypothetical protein
MAKVDRVTYFVLKVEDKPGALLKVMQDLKTKGIGLAGVWAVGAGEGMARVFAVPKTPEKLRAAWKASGQLSEEATGFFLKGADRTGALLKPLEALAAAGVNMDVANAIAVGGRFGCFIFVKAGDVEKAAEALGSK